MLTPDLVFRFAISLTMLVFGISQITKPETWVDYMPMSMRKTPEASDKQMRIHSLGNIVFGLLFFINVLPKTAAWIVLVWWLIILPFAFKKNWTIGMRDLTIILAIASYILTLYQS